MNLVLSLLALVAVIELADCKIISDPKCTQPCPLNYEPVNAEDSKGTTKTFSNSCAMRVWNDCHNTDFKETCDFSCDDSDNDKVTASDSQGTSYDFQSCCFMIVKNLCDKTDYSCDKCEQMLEEGKVKVYRNGRNYYDSKK